MDKELTVLKWVLIVRLKIPQMPQKVLAQNGKSTDYGHAKAKDVSKMKCTNWLLHYFTTLSGHILANYISIFHKTEVFMDILRCQMCPNLNWIKTTR